MSVYKPLRAPLYVDGLGVVASEHPLASLAGAEILRRGGNAVDAAVATSFVLSVVLPHLSGVGGDFFALIKIGERMKFINGSCGAPQAMSSEMLISLGYNSVPERGPLSINPPGFVAGVHAMWRQGGSIEWKELLLPAINLAKKGHPISNGFAAALIENRDLLARDPGSRRTYSEINPVPGSIARYPGLARLLEMIAEDPTTFYHGEPARAIEDYVASRGGVLSVRDLARCRAEIGEPLSITYHGCSVYEMPPNTQGIATLHALLLSEELGAERYQRGSREWIRTLLRIFNAVYWARDRFLGDPRYMEKNAYELLSSNFLEELKRRLEPSSRARHMRQDGSDTTFFAIADREGNLVAGIQSLFHAFGSGLTEPLFQVTLNSRASCFTLRNGVNRLEPGKRPLHTLSAPILDCGREIIVHGLSGGHYRPQLHLQIIEDIVARREDPAKAIEAPRFAWIPGTNKIIAEEGVDADVPGMLVEKRPYPSRLGVAAAIVINGSTRKAYTDPRGDGLAVSEPWF